MRKTTSDRRHCSRYNHSIPVSLHDPAQSLLDCRSTVLNLSMTGICIETTAKIGPETSFFFELHLPDGTSVNGMAEYRWEQKPLSGPYRRYGVWILFMDPISERALSQYLFCLSSENRVRSRA